MKNVKKAGGNMNESFKFKVYFEENGKEIEKLISHLLSILCKNKENG